MERLLIVDRDLFSGLNVAQREEQHMPVQGPHVSIWLAGVIDVVGAVTASRAIQTEPAVDITNAQDAPITRALPRLEISNALAGVLSDFPPALKKNCREAALTVNS